MFHYTGFSDVSYVKIVILATFFVNQILKIVVHILNQLLLKIEN